MKTKEEYENLIDNSCLFDLDRNCQASAYRRESLKMIEYLYNYLMLTNENKYQSYGLEIEETAILCINGYDKSKGRFLIYFMTAWKNNYSHIISKELFESDFTSMKFPERIRRDYVKYKMCCTKLGIDTTHPDFDEKVSEYLNIALDDVRELRILEDSKTASIDSLRNFCGEEQSTQIPSESNAEEDYIQRDTCMRFLDNIEGVFFKIQGRQKAAVSMLLTANLAFEFEDEVVFKYFKTKQFYDERVFRMCVDRGEPISNRIIAEMLGVKESSLSRTWKGFKEKINDDSISLIFL